MAGPTAGERSQIPRALATFVLDRSWVELDRDTRNVPVNFCICSAACAMAQPRGNNTAICSAPTAATPFGYLSMIFTFHGNEGSAAPELAFFTEIEFRRSR